jgi:hypothetical protein
VIAEIFIFKIHSFRSQQSSFTDDEHYENDTEKTILFNFFFANNLPWHKRQVWTGPGTNTEHIRGNYLCAADASSLEPASEPALKSLKNGSESTGSTKK